MNRLPTLSGSRQVSVNQVPIRTFMRSAPFTKGFRDAQAKKPFDYKYVDGVEGVDAWRYERGRLFGLIYDGKLKTKNRVEDSAILAYVNARRDGTIR